MWICNEREITELPSIWRNKFGFVYKITTSEGRMYIGYKYLFSKRKKKYGKKKLALMTDKRLKKYEYIIKESDWLSYTGSSKELNADIARGVTITKEILEVADNKQHLTYLETKYLFVNEVLEDNRYYNGNILGKFYTIK